ncbi:unnamed protein product [Schistocephalus solidus]|uniref:ATP-dependent RNA helicase DOB1 n=1 Tax=Schistocephalus solidus TaxID=70667 RepID=A0A183SNQ3_SCHSO|nr:unnamed protein product [Schistocephalus solidus]
MSNIFGLDIDDLKSVFDTERTREISIEPSKPKEAQDEDSEFEEKKRALATKRSKLTVDMKTVLSNNSSNSNHPTFRSFSFTLDSFQQQAITCIDNNQSVMVSAHTSAGKTVVAEYAIAMALREKQRVIYTTPIKALSNQKYREFSEEFPEVGLLTGDATINMNASVLIMTTEILQSMLYRGASIMREVGWVVFDEIHYMRDPERGVVWEETLVLLPDSVRFVFLSATTPNARQFAEWIAYLHHQPCHVVRSEARPVPLRHYIYPLGSDGLYLVLDEVTNFLPWSPLHSLTSTPSFLFRLPLVMGLLGTENNVVKMVRLVKQRNLEPIIVFSFSKKECEIYALQMAECDFNTPAEKKVVEEVFKNAISGLSPEDRSLPQVESVLPLLVKGIGIHHGGLLPILKETIEILFGEGLIKVRVFLFLRLFKVGICGKCAVYFMSNRRITAGEYIQMSGRAGRRGKDASGTVIMMVDETLNAETARQILLGQPAPLNSAFHITYNMLLNLLRVEEINPEYLMERSFCQFQNYASLPELDKELNELQQAYNSTKLEDEESIESYQQIRMCLHDVLEHQWKYVRRPEYIVPFLQPGRLIKVETEREDYGWGVVINLKKRHRTDRSSAPETFYLIDCLLADRPKKTETETAAPAEEQQQTAEAKADILPVRLDCVRGISAVRLVVPNDLRSADARNTLFSSIGKIQQKMGGSLPPLDPIDDMHIKDSKFKEITQVREFAFEERLQHHWLNDDPRLPDLLAAYEKRDAQHKRIEALSATLTKKLSLIQLDELTSRKRILRRLGFCNEHDIIELKGRVACEITSADELLLTELLFEGIFNRLSPEHTAALLSCFVFSERASEMPSLTKDLSSALQTLQDTARRIARISNECHLPVDTEAYVDSFKPHLMDLVVSWANGASFASICTATDLFEGTIIRSLRLLEELLRQMTNAARTIGNAGLEAKFSEGGSFAVLFCCHSLSN